MADDTDTKDRSRTQAADATDGDAAGPRDAPGPAETASPDDPGGGASSPDGWRRFWPDPGPKRIALIAVLALVGVYVAYAVFVAVPNGTDVHVYIEAGTEDDGSMFYRCDVERSTPGACDPAGTDGDPDQARIVVDRRDRVTMTVHSLDGGGRAHDFKLEGAPYFLWPAGIEMELHDATESKSFTAWNAGTFKIRCEIPGHEEAGMWATLVVRG